MAVRSNIGFFSSLVQQVSSVSFLGVSGASTSQVSGTPATTMTEGVSLALAKKAHIIGNSKIGDKSRIVIA